MTRIAFIGLGNMGTPMVQHLIAAGHTVRAYVRRPEAADNARTLGAEPCNTPAEAARDAEVIFTNVTSTADVESVLLGPDGVIHGAPRGAVCIDHSTISAVATRRIAADLEAAGLEFLDAPVSGGTAGAQKATLSIMVGGKAEVLERVRPLLQLLGTTITHVGGHGAGQVAKACNQIVQVINIQGIAEAMLFARAQGTDPSRVLAAIGPGFAGSRMLDLEGPKMAERNFAAGIEARLHDKDFGLVREIAQELGLQMPAMELVASQLNTLVANGWGYDDTASLLRVLEQQNKQQTD
ncbi:MULTISPECIES: NAD(P)-dependent oxidoreductase [Ralstonia]|jgi:3-hydroxyisobutyrate dehydrogenase-like beta-hydroxyacid dehydrogenase|uniref:2-hydroxy-3-oxopropionate reductase n=4 Tax=Pseudomonadota TaxID=1224 RepID=A0ABM9IJH1_RALPI|nr:MULTISPECIES: NAD(P)-dependent oxidoreductase [Ralstonia]MBA4015558.1 NAD(P)-dependent oxidoreductase [Ralstonia sp.]MBA4199341.1 NAD(P)-dependent oxidoreductase [Ralstonia sp.]MBA4229556.1 NAD(P)-dependent oxidoreductase [Ralstonia sp.]MBA4236626.1 NAD(P)-dependent oxidoreductase [Ralstonia sp.]MBA4401592.1 NAD(P)-dependent oxidoreductase [Ralstonia sp.]